MTHGQIPFFVVLCAALIALMSRPLVALRRVWDWKSFLCPLSTLLFPFGFGVYWKEEFVEGNGLPAVLGIYVAVFAWIATAFGASLAVGWFWTWCNAGN